MVNNISIKLNVPATDFATKMPSTTLVFEAGSQKMYSGHGVYDGKPCLILSAKNHNGRVGEEALSQPNPTVLVVFETPESIDLMLATIRSLKADTKSLK